MPIRERKAAAAGKPGKTPRLAPEPADDAHGAGLDRYDIAILGELQRDARLSNAELATHVPVHVKLEGEGPVPDDTPSPTVLIDDIENLAEELHIPVPGHEATHTKE